jgi:hypothetical protein
MIYRLVTRNTYEAEMFVRASKKLGIDQAVLTNLTHGAAAIEDEDRTNIDKLLKLGAYGVFTEDDAAAQKFSEADIDDILANYTHVVTTGTTGTARTDADEESGGTEGEVGYEPEDDANSHTHSEKGKEKQPGAGIKFSKMTFTSAASDAAVDIYDPDFWCVVNCSEPPAPLAPRSSAHANRPDHHLTQRH